MAHRLSSRADDMKPKRRRCNSFLCRSRAGSAESEHFPMFHKRKEGIPSSYGTQFDRFPAKLRRTRRARTPEPRIRLPGLPSVKRIKCFTKVISTLNSPRRRSLRGSPPTAFAVRIPVSTMRVFSSVAQRPARSRGRRYRPPNAWNATRIGHSNERHMNLRRSGRGRRRGARLIPFEDFSHARDIMGN